MLWSYDGKALPEHVCRYLLGVYYEVDVFNRFVKLEYYTKGKRTINGDIIGF
jgi:hypothetical protein